MFDPSTSRGPKTIRRLGVVAGHVADRLSPPLFGLLVSLVVVRRASIEVWGTLVAIQVAVQLGAHVAGWGNKDYLLREFGASPGRIAEAWRGSLATRLAAFTPALAAALLLPMPPAARLGAVLWCLGLLLHQSFEVVVLCRRDFPFAVALEIGSALLVAGLAGLRASPPSLAELVAWFALASWSKAAALLVRYRRRLLSGPRARLDAGYFARALPFFLIGLTGLLQSRADLYAAVLFLNAGEVGRYQILVTLLGLLQSATMFLVAPYARSLYRLPLAAIERLARRTFALGLILTPVGLAASRLLLVHLYRLEIPVPQLLLAALVVLPSFVYTPLVYGLFKARLPGSVARASAAAAVVNLALSLLLLPRLATTGALISSAVAQWLLLAAYAGLIGSARRGGESAPRALDAAARATHPAGTRAARSPTAPALRNDA